MVQYIHKNYYKGGSDVTLTNPEIISHPQAYNHHLLASNFGTLPADVQTDWLRIRQDFVEQKGWRSGDDYDDYDSDASTLQLLLQNTQGDVSAGLRLTPRDSIQDTLSWGMLPDLAESDIADLTGPVWDLTRAIPGAVDNPHQIMPALAELFGAGLAATQLVDSNPRWVFATDRQFMAAFKRYGIEFTPIDGTRRGDYQLSYAYPAVRTQFLIDHQDQFPAAHASVQRGIATMQQGSRI